MELFSLQLKLWRRGWALKSSHVSSLSLFPWMITVALLLAAISLRVFGKVSVALLIAGVCAQLGLAGIAVVSAPYGAPSLWRALDEGMAVAMIDLWMEGLSPILLGALLAAIVCIGLVLMIRERKNKSSRSGYVELFEAFLAFVGIAYTEG